MGKTKKEKYTIVSNSFLQDKRLSLKAKGLLTLMLSLPEDWNYSVKGLISFCKDGKDSVNSALKELEIAGYITRKNIKDELGHFKGTKIIFVNYLRNFLDDRLDEL